MNQSTRYTCTCDAELHNKLGCDYVYPRQKVLALPQWSQARKFRLQKGYSPDVCVDGCIVEAILILWDKGIETTGSCCGHNSESAWVSVHPDDYVAMFELGYEQRPVDIKDDGSVHGLYTFYL